MNTKNLGDLAEQLIIVDLLKRGYTVATIVGDNAPYDLIVDRNGSIERIQVKCRTPKDGKLVVEFYSMHYNATTGSNNRTKQVLYNNSDIDWYAVVDAETHQCYYIPSHTVEGRQTLTLRIEPTLSNQTVGVTLAEDFTEI